MEITTMEQFLNLDPDKLTANDSPDWMVLFGHFHAYHSLLERERAAVQERNRLGLDPRLGIARSLSEQLKAYATACYCVARAGEPQSFRLRAVQESIKGGHSAWHAASVASNKLSECPCAKCRIKQGEKLVKI